MKKLWLSMITMFFIGVLLECAYAQPGPERRISVSFKDIMLLDLLSYLQTVYDIDFYYRHNVTLDRKVSIRATNLPLTIFLERLCGEADLTYQVIDNHIVLKKKIPAVKAPPDSPGFPARSAAIPGPPGAGKQALRPMKKLQPIASLLSTVTKGLTPSENHVPEVVPVVRDSLEGTGNEKMKGFSLGLSAFYHHDSYHFRESPDGQQYRTRRGYGLGVSGMFWLNKTLGITLGVFFSKRGYRVAYNFKAVTPEDPFSFPANTLACLSYVEIPAGLAFRLFTSDKFTLSVSTRLIMSYMTGNRERTAFLNGSKKSTMYLAGANADLIWGGAVGVRLWYTLHKSIKIYLGPDYTHSFNLVNRLIMRAGSPAFKANIGISLNM